MRSTTCCASACESAGPAHLRHSPDERLVEVVELDDHPFFVASQFHPEFKSRPERPAPLFRGFVGGALGAARRVERRRVMAMLRQSAHDGRCGQPRPAPRAAPAQRTVRGARAASKARRGASARAPSVSKAELRALGLDVHEDDAGAEAGSDCGNLLARIPARAEFRRGLPPAVRAPGHCALRAPWSPCWWMAAGRTPTRASSARTTRPLWP